MCILVSSHTCMSEDVKQGSVQFQKFLKGL